MATPALQPRMQIDPRTGLPIQSNGMADPYSNDSVEGGDPYSAQGGGTLPPNGPSSFPTNTPPYTPSSANGSDFSNLVSGDQNKINRQIISNTLGEGSNLINTAGQQQNYYGGQEQGATDQFKKQYDPIWSGGGGYTPGQQQDILQQGGPTGTDALQFLASGKENGQNFLTPAEQASIAGDPYKASKVATSGVNQLQSGSTDEATRQRQINTSGSANLTGDVGQMAKGYAAAIDPTKLTESSGYVAGQGAALGQGAEAMSAATSNPDLNVTDQYKQQAGMTDEEVNQTANLGAEEAGSQYQALQDQTTQNALAAGETNPMALAAEQENLIRQKGAATVDAGLRARLAARAAQRTAAQGVQSTELGAGQFKTGAELNAAQDLLQSRLSSGQQVENTRLGAEQDLSGREMTAAGDVGLAAIGTDEYSQGQAGATEAGIANRQAQIGEYGTSTQTAATQAAETAAQQRANEIATNRQQTQVYNQANQFSQASAVNQALSNRYSSIANKYQDQQQEGRAAAAGQMQYEGGQANAAGQRQLGAYQTETAGAGSQAATYASSKNQQSANGFFGSNGLFGKLAADAAQGAKAGGFAKGTILTHPTHLTMADGSEAIAGEAPDPHSPTGYGYEAILPLTDPNFEPMLHKALRARRQLMAQAA